MMETKIMLLPESSVSAIKAFRKLQLFFLLFFFFFFLFFSFFFWIEATGANFPKVKLSWIYCSLSLSLTLSLSPKRKNKRGGGCGGEVELEISRYFISSKCIAALGGVGRGWAVRALLGLGGGGARGRSDRVGWVLVRG